MAKVKKENRVRRNSNEIEPTVFEAIKKIIIERGFIGLKINPIEEYSKVDKKTIYRHFGSLQNLLTKYISKNDYWLPILEPLKDYKIEKPREFLKGLIVNLYYTMFPNKELQQTIKWELSELSERTKAVTQQREDLSAGLIRQFEEFFEGSGLDFNAFSAMLIASIYYMILHKEHSTICLLDINKEKDRVPIMFEMLIDMFFDKLEEHHYKQDIVRKMKAKGYEILAISEITGLDANLVEKL